MGFYLRVLFVCLFVFFSFCDLSLLCDVSVRLLFVSFSNILKFWGLAFWSLSQGVGGVMDGLGLVF